MLSIKWSSNTGRVASGKNLHSTMLSIKSLVKSGIIKNDGIYIPLCYLLNKMGIRKFKRQT